MLTVGNIDDGSIKNMTLHGNMQGRAEVGGVPGNRENEHAVYVVGCKGFVIENVATHETMGDGISIGYAMFRSMDKSVAPECLEKAKYRRRRKLL